MLNAANIRALPAFAALDSHAVIEGLRRGASIQLDKTYFDGQLRVLKALDSITGIDNRIKIIRQSSDLYTDINIDFDSVNRENLLDASQRYRSLLQQLPEVIALQNTFPETCIVVPEWLRTEREVKYGARIYFFRDDDAPDPDEIIQTNIEAVVTENREPFEKYQGHLHGYPECCIQFMENRTSDPPEIHSVTPFADHINDSLLDNNDNTSISIDQIVSGFSNKDDFYSFFARAFYPEPGCDTAVSKGKGIYNEIADSYTEGIAKDHFCLNFGISYVRGRGVVEGAKSHPRPGILGCEHLHFYMPLQSLLTLSRYN